MNSKTEYNKLGNFDLDKFIRDLKDYGMEHPSKYVLHRRIARETGLNQETVRFALFGNVSSFKTVIRLAGWAELWLDEYRVE